MSPPSAALLVTLSLFLLLVLAFQVDGTWVPLMPVIGLDLILPPHTDRSIHHLSPAYPHPSLPPPRYPSHARPSIPFILVHRNSPTSPLSTQSPQSNRRR